MSFRIKHINLRPLKTITSGFGLIFAMIATVNEDINFDLDPSKYMDLDWIGSMYGKLYLYYILNLLWISIKNP